MTILPSAVVGVDVGQAHDPAAVIRIIPTTSRPRSHGDPAPVWHVHTATTIPIGETYADLARYIAHIATDVIVLVDRTGIGRAVVEAARVAATQPANIIGVTWTAGNTPYRIGLDWRVPKSHLVGALDRAITHAGLAIPPHHRTLVSELGAYRNTGTTTNAATGHHDDTVAALALAVYGGDYLNSLTQETR